MPIPSKPGYSHGSTGTQPSTAIDYANGDAVDQAEFDYFIYTEFSKIKGIIDFLDTVDSDGDGQVDAADTATDATNVTSTYKGNDIDSDGDGKVDAADDATNVTSTYKGNDIDSDGDGRVDAADVAQNAAGDFSLDGDLTTTDGETLWDETNGYIPQARLEHDSLTVAGNTVSLNGSTAVAHGDLTNIGASDHHTRYSNSEARSAVEGTSSITDLVGANAPLPLEVYATEADLPNASEGEIAYVQSKGQLYIEDGS